MARRNAEPTEMIRIDKKGRFVGFYDDTLVSLGKIRVAFVEYDAKNQRTAHTVQYIDEEDMLLFADCVWNDDIRKLAKHYRDSKENFKSLLPFVAMGGKKGGRKDNTDLARKFDLFPGNPGQYLLQGEEGLGRQNAQGLFVPAYGNKPDQRVKIYLTEAELKKVASVLRAKIEAKMSAEYVYRFSDEMRAQAKEEKAQRDAHKNNK